VPRSLISLQSYGDLIRSIAGVEDSAGATFFAAALSANTSARSAGSTSDLRHPQVVLPADPTASAKKLSGTATPTPTGAAQVRGRSFDTDVSGSMSGSAAPGKGDRTALLGKASAGFLREMHAGNGGASAAPSGAATPAYPFAPLSRANSTLPQSAAEAEAQSTEYLLARSEELILEMERLFNPSAEPATGTGAGVSISALMHKAEHLSAAALGNNNTYPRERVAEESILRQGSSQVSAKILATASTGKASVSWGGVQENEGPGSAR